MQEALTIYKDELVTELNNILSYWMNHDTDDQYGGFIGRVDHANQPDSTADKGSVLNSRILWAFSAAYRLTKQPLHLQYAERAYHYFVAHFIDKTNGGVYWSVNYKGKPADRKKQVYAQSFAIYALSEFFHASGMAAAKQQAIDLFNTIEAFSYHPGKGGYIDAFSETWTTMPDLRLSEKDANEKKTMNTHLHVLEAYTNLYRIWPDAGLKTKIRNLLHHFMDYIVDEKTGHLILFFDEDWNRKSTMVSYGHEIEAAWLLQEAAEAIDDALLISATRQAAITMANAAAEGLDGDGGLWYEYEPLTHHLIKEKHWWPQAEAMVGFFNAWQVSGDHEYLQRSLSSWLFIKAHILDRQKGEWVWGVYADYSEMADQDKVGIWKCPYHNGRACIELIKRIGIEG